MQAYLTLVRRELAGHFLSLRGYVIMAGVQFLLGASLCITLEALNQKPFDMPITEKMPNTGFFWLILLLVAPVITMRTFAHERAIGTFETLLTTPISDWAVVLAKFTGALAFFLLTWLPALAYPFILTRYVSGMGAVDLGPLASLIIGITMLGSFMMAVGCFASALTKSQIIAAMTSFAICTGVFLLGFISVIRPPWIGSRSELFSHLSMLEHMGDFASGVVDTRHVVFYASLTALFLFFTQKTISLRRWR